MSSNVEEIEPKEQKIEPGFLGNLNDEQHTALVKMWQSYFDICDKARGKATKGSGFKEDKSGKDPKKSGIPEDDAAKDEAKKLEEQQGMNELLETYGSEALRDGWWNFVKQDNPDAIMLKFVRARKGDIGRGMAMMATMLRWRLDTDVESLVLKGDLTNGKEIPKFIEQMKSGKVKSLGCTGLDEPICYVIMKYHSVFAQPAASMQQFIVTQMETFRLLMAPPVDKACIFFDLKGFGVKQMDFVSLLYLVKVLEAYYPESLSKMYISNAPWVFWSFWSMVKNLLDPVVRSKIVFITGPAETGEHVPAERMIKYCGGKVETEFKFVDPQEGENDVQKDSATKQKLLDRHRRLTDQFEKVTREWCEKDGQDEELNEKRQVLIKKLRLSQFILDPYVRGMTVYHRNEVLQKESPGIAAFDYIVGGKTTRQVIGKPTSQKSLERELCEIAAGSTTKQADEKTKQMIEDGTWGQWRVNDNSDSIKAKAAAALEDVEGTAKPEQLEKADPVMAKKPSRSTKKSAKASSDEGDDAGADAGGAAAAGGAGAGAAAAASSGNRRDSDTPSSKPRKRSVVSTSSTKYDSSPPPPAPKQDEPLVIPYTSTRKARKMMKESSNGTMTKKKGLFGSLRARIAAL